MGNPQGRTAGISRTASGNPELMSQAPKLELKMSVRKRTWLTAGVAREAWVVDYVDADGGRHIKTFARKRDADAHHADVTVNVAKGVHTPESRSLTVAQAGEQWLTAAELERLERSTLDHYRTHVIKHIAPRIGAAKLATLTTPQVNAFRDELVRNLSRPMARKVLASFRSIIIDARRRGTIAHNVAEGVRIGGDKRATRKLEVGRDIPTPDEVRRILAAAEGVCRPFLVVAAFAGLARLGASRPALVRYRSCRRRHPCPPTSGRLG